LINSWHFISSYNFFGISICCIKTFADTQMLKHGKKENADLQHLQWYHFYMYFVKRI